MIYMYIFSCGCWLFSLQTLSADFFSSSLLLITVVSVVSVLKSRNNNNNNNNNNNKDQLYDYNNTEEALPNIDSEVDVYISSGGSGGEVTGDICDETNTE